MTKAVQKISAAALCLLLAWTLLLLPACVSAPVVSALNYAESIEAIANPDNGFYKTATVKLTDSGVTGDVSAVQKAEGLVQMQIGLGDYCAYTGSSRPLSEGALTGLSALLAQLRARNATALLCFSYDDFETKISKEPPLSVILSHVRQLSRVFYDCEDVITAIRIGFAGTDGSFTGSSVVSEENMYRVTAQVLASSPVTTRVLLNAPRYLYGYLGLTLQSVVGKDFTKNGEASRLGVFDGGYMTSDTDGGFYTERSAETAWLYRLCDEAFFGGRTGKAEEDFRQGADFAAQEMFVTHVAFLDARASDTLAEWKATPYNGSETAYAGENYYSYIGNRLGYRLLLTEAALPQKAGGGDKLDVRVTLKNLGCGNVMREKKAEILFVGSGGVYCKEIELDVTKVKSLSQKTFAFTVKTDKDMAAGDYTVYLRVAARKYGAEGGGAIRFCNTAEQYDGVLGGNRIGKITLR